MTANLPAPHPEEGHLRFPAVMRACAAAGVASAFLCVAAADHTPRIERIHIVDRGIYHAETTGRDGDAARNGTINTVQNPRLVNDTSAIVGQVGVRFGLRYIAMGTDGSVQLKLIVRFPVPGLRDPATGRISFQSEFEARPAPGATNYWEYHFENGWEVVPGPWTFEFWLENRKLAEQRFCVSEPGNLSAAIAAMTGQCPSGPLQGTR